LSSNNEKEQLLLCCCCSLTGPPGYVPVLGGYQLSPLPSGLFTWCKNCHWIFFYKKNWFWYPEGTRGCALPFAPMTQKGHVSCILVGFLSFVCGKS
jgi:hypothetical protein